ncbi:MAG: ABC transporter ATP-binding protein, partial [Planctomycetia bacterium]
LLHRPRVLFLDEPTDGVDPVGRKQIRDLLLAERDRGVTIFINSHLLGEVEQLCDRVAILRRGTVVRTGRVAELSGDKPSWLVAFDREPPADWRPFGGRLLPATDGRLRLVLEPADPSGLDGFLASATAAGRGLRHLERERDTLEELDLRLAAPEATP